MELGAPKRDLPKVSASQIETFKRCKRLWYYQKVYGIKTPSSPAQELGVKIHEGIEAYYNRESIPEDVKKYVDVAVTGLPPPGTNIRVEKEFTVRTYTDGPLLTGFVDLEIEPIDSTEVFEILDHKTTSNFKYAKTQEQLRYNVQALVYAHQAFEEYPGLNVLRFTHNNILTRGTPNSDCVTITFTREHVRTEWEKICEVIKQMKALAANGPDSPLELAPPEGFEPCKAYGGCFFYKNGECRDVVEVTSLTKQVSKKQKEPVINMESLMERLKAKKAEQAQGKAEAPLIAAPAEPTPIVEEVPIGVVPPDAPPRETSPEEAAAAGAEKAKKKASTKKAGKAAAEVVADASKDINPAPNDASKDIMTRLGKVLLVDSIVTDSNAALREYGSIPEPAERWLDGIKTELAKQIGEQHYSLAEFGKGRGILAAAIKEAIETCPRVCHIASMTGGAHELMEEFHARGWLVHRAVKG